VLIAAWRIKPTTSERRAGPIGALARDLRIRRGPAKGLGLAAMVGLMAFSLIAYRSFGARLTRAWSTYLAGLGYLVAATLLLTRGKGLAYLWPRTWWTRVALGTILLLALGLRLVQLGSLPAGTWYDEALSGLQGAQWIEDPAYRPQFENTNNNSGQTIWLYATAQRWFGRGTWAIRLVPALLGCTGVLAAYLFGSELRGPRFGLVMAFTLAVARWHVNFSRIAMPGIDTPLFVFASLFFLTRLLRGGRLRDAVWAGLSLGLGLSTYSAFRLFLLALGVYGILFLLRWRKRLLQGQDGKRWFRLGARVGALGLALWLAALPVVHFSLNQPAAFWDRVRKTSLFHNREEASLAVAIGRSTRQHLLMFNVAGDRNGRHNLYGEPTLDPAMGVVFVLGLALALARVRQPANLFFVLLFPVGLLGGILSLDFEAPQSLRSIAAMPAVICFCALAFSTLVERLGQAARPRLATAWRATAARTKRSAVVQ
jgi:4-amino-4-deoxy-L-arabinose transferase-like glycosyltransferase